MAPPAWARSVQPNPGDDGRAGDLILFAQPSRAGGRRGVTVPGASLPFFAVKRGSGCNGRWWLVGPLAWVCSDDAELAPDEPSAPEPVVGANGLAVQYFFVGPSGARAYTTIESAQEGEADRELESGWGVAVVERRSAGGESWARTTKGLWIAARELFPARSSAFHGAPLVGGRLDVGWVVGEAAPTWPAPSRKGKAGATRPRLTLVHVVEESGDGPDRMVRIDDDGGVPVWLRASAVARPTVAQPPSEITRADERWIDVDLATQTLVAYEGARPVYATVVSTGRGPAGAGTATPPGVHRVWVKLRASTMDDVERDDVDAHYSLEDVPYVQFFDRGVALHGTYWHDDFGRPRSHGCVNLSPLDARWLFTFTGPKVPASWVAAYPIPVDKGTLVRVH